MKDTQTPSLAASLVMHQRCFNTLTTDDAQDAIKHTKDFIAIACRAWKNRPASKRSSTLYDQLAKFQKFYTKVFGYENTPVKVVLPPETPGFNWAIVIRKGLTLKKVIEVINNQFEFISEVDENFIDKIDHPVENDYCVFTRDYENTHHGDEYDSSSKIRCIATLEHLILFLFYKWDTGEYLDGNHTMSRTYCKDELVISADKEHKTLYVTSWGRLLNADPNYAEDMRPRMVLCAE